MSLSSDAPALSPRGASDGAARQGFLPAVFHIGANKAGSTTLQRALFARHPGVLNIGKPDPGLPVRQAMNAIFNACDSREKSHQLDIDAIRGLWRGAVASAETSGRVAIFSHEEMIRHHFYDQADPLRLPKAVVAMAGPVRVVMVIRHQVRLLESLYLHKFCQFEDYDEVEEWLESDTERTAYGYRYYEVADAWARVIGEANVGVFLFEEMTKDVVSFASRLCSFIGIDPAVGIELLSNKHENVRKSNRVFAYARLRSWLLPAVSLSPLLPRPLHQAWQTFLDGGRRPKLELPPHWVRQIEDKYRASNRELAQRFKLPLEAYNYPL